ncbi:MAG: DUF4124 domain-containing protein [Gammaproteobacteria bacterium]
MNKQSVTLLIVCLTTLFSGVAMADGTQIYKWTDSQGVVHYSDKAPNKPEQNVTIMSLPALPQPDPQALAQDQAWIASINTWYQSVLKDQAQLEYGQLLASEEAQPPQAESTPDYTQQVSYVTPVYGNSWRSGFRHPHHPSRPIHGPQSRQPMFQSSIWNTQSNPFTQQLYKP